MYRRFNSVIAYYNQNLKAGNLDVICNCKNLVTTIYL